jgi:hypothetical protein
MAENGIAHLLMEFQQKQRNGLWNTWINPFMPYEN